MENTLITGNNNYSFEKIDGEVTKTLVDRLNETHHWIECEYCNGTGNAKTITLGCFFCTHPMIKDGKPGFRWVKK